MITPFAAIPCFPAGTPHHLEPIGTDANGRRIERCVFCDSAFRMPADGIGGGALALDIMSSNVAQGVTPTLTNPARGLVCP